MPIMYKIREIIGDKKQLHVQVTASDTEDMIKEAEYITKNLGMDTYIKVPTNETGIKTIKLLKTSGYNVTATAIYTVQQALLASSVGADYVAPYINRMYNNNCDAMEAVSDMADLFITHGKETKILAASFKNTNQILGAFLAGSHAATASPDLYTMMVTSPLVDAAIKTFDDDWKNLYGDKRIYEF